MGNAVLLKKISGRFFGLLKLISSIKSTICRSWKNTIWSTDFNNKKTMQGKNLFFGDCVFTKVLYRLREQKNIPSLLVYTLYLIMRIAYTVQCACICILSPRRIACRFRKTKYTKNMWSRFLMPKPGAGGFCYGWMKWVLCKPHPLRMSNARERLLLYPTHSYTHSLCGAIGVLWEFLLPIVKES